MGGNAGGNGEQKHAKSMHSWNEKKQKIKESI